MCALILLSSVEKKTHSHFYPSRNCETTSICRLNQHLRCPSRCEMIIWQSLFLLNKIEQMCYVLLPTTKNIYVNVFFSFLTVSKVLLKQSLTTDKIIADNSSSLTREHIDADTRPQNTFVVCALSPHQSVCVNRSSVLTTEEPLK